MFTTDAHGNLPSNAVFSAPGVGCARVDDDDEVAVDAIGVSTSAVAPSTRSMRIPRDVTSTLASTTLVFAPTTAHAKRMTTSKSDGEWR